MSTSLEERLFHRELRALYKANRQQSLTGAEIDAFDREARRRARLRAQDPLELRAHECRETEYHALFQEEEVG